MSRAPASPEIALMPPTRVRYRVLLAACAVAVVSYIHRIGFATAFTEMKGPLELSSTDLGYIMAAFLVAYAGFEIPCGALGDRWGVRNLLTALVLGWSVLTGCLGLVMFLPALWLTPFLFLLVVRFLFGMLQAGCYPSLSRMMADWMPVRERGTAQGLIWMSSRMGGAIVPLLLGLMFAYYSWEISMAQLMLLGLVWCLVFWPWFRNRPEEMPQVNDAEAQVILLGRSPLSRKHLSWSQLFQSKSVWGLCLMYGCGGFSASFFVTMLPDYLRNHRHFSEHQSRLLTSLPLACGVVGCVLGGLLSDWIIRRFRSRKWGRRFNGAVGMVLAGAAFTSTIWVETPLALAILLCVTFFFNDINMGPAWAACADIGERYAGTVGGAMNMVGNMCAALMTVVSGLLLDRTAPIEIFGRSIGGHDLLFVIFGVVFSLGASCWFLVDASRPLAAEVLIDPNNDQHE
ncbi:MAG: MFS transporter [Planctomycetes bacterium]|nr:MFS transporter [Planctomycetota bacterium]